MVGTTGYCGIDLGTQGVRAVIIDETGHELGSGSSPLTSERPRAGTHEQGPQQWWDALVASVRQAVSQAAVEVRAVAVDATSGTVLVQGSDGTARGPALMYDDTRADRQARRAESVGRELWTELGYHMQATWSLPKAMWLVEEQALATGDLVVHQSDHVVRRLTGHPVATDSSNALKTGVDLRTVSWPTELFAELGLPVTRLPDVVLPGHVLGRVSAAAAAETGLAEGTPVRAGMTDGCASQIAAGALHTGSWSSALGTTLVVKGATAELLRDPQGAVYCHRHPDGGWLPGGASSTGAGAIRSAFGDDADLGRLTEQARARVPVAGITYPLTGSGERFPFVAPDARGFTAPGVSDDADLFASLCQGIAYVERLVYDVLRVLSADTTGPVALTGGAARNAWWNQLRTDVLGRPTTVPLSGQAATGMAILAAAETGDLTGTAERMVVVEQRLQPDRERGRALQDGYVALVDELAGRGWLGTDLAHAVLETSGVVS